jgi:hypothetical protein
VSRRLKQVAGVFFLVFAVAQFVGPERANPPTDVSRTIEARLGTASGLVRVLDRACNDCHSNRTVWPGNTQVAPVSWLMVYAVREGRKAVNFSEWASYQPEVQRRLLGASCRDASNGTMPGSPGCYCIPRPGSQPRMLRQSARPRERSKWGLPDDDSSSTGTFVSAAPGRLR